MGMGIDYGLQLFADYQQAEKQGQIDRLAKAKRDAEMSLIDPETESKRTGFENSSDLSRAQMRVRPGATANQIKRQGNEAIGLETAGERAGFELSQEPTRQATIKATEGAGLSAAQTTEANQGIVNQTNTNKAAGGLLQSQAEIEALPEKIHRAKKQGVLDDQGQQDVILGTFGGLVARGDKAAALNFINKLAQHGGFMDAQGVQFTDIQEMQRGIAGAKEDGYLVTSSDGQSDFIPARAIGAAINAQKTGKYHFIERADGSVVAGNEKTGAATVVQNGSQDILEGKTGKSQPAAVATAKWLISSGVAKDATQAWALVKSAQEKTKAAFIMDYVSKNAGMGKDGTTLAAEAQKVYEDVKKSMGAGLDNAIPTGVE